MFDIITFGSATQDIVVKPKLLTLLKYAKESSIQDSICFPFGSKIDVEDIVSFSGGGGTNSAVTFSLQGFKTAFVGIVGDDLAGREILKELKNFRVDTKYVFKTDKKSTNQSVVILETGKDRTIFAYRGASELLNKEEIPFSKLRAKWFYIAPLTGLLCDSFEDIIKFAFKNKIKIAVNPGVVQLSLPCFLDILKKVDILILNQEEASFLTKIPFEKEKDVFKKLDEICPGIAVMTKGNKGVTVSDGKTIYSAKPDSERKIIDTTGAGDSFGSGFVSGFIKNNGNIEKAIQMGMANSAGCLSQMGAKNGLLKKDQSFNKVAVNKVSIMI